MAALLRKADLKAQLVAQMTAAVAAARHAHEAAIEGATHEQAKPENDKDTRGLEQSYLARGLAQRIEELEAALVEVEVLALRRFGPRDRIALSALITVEEDGGTRHYFVAPQGGGALLAGGAVHVVTPRSPLGRALVGKRAGDDVEVRLPGGLRDLVVVAVE